MGYKSRDVEVCMLEQGLCLVAACDSCGAIGDKPLDQLKVPARIVGQLTARLVLMEVLCTGALPCIMTVGISSEPTPTGKNIMEGVQKELEQSGFKDLPIAMSTEKNFTPSQTGLGIGLTGICQLEDLRIGGSIPLDQVYCIGMPKVGQEVVDAGDHDIINTRHIRNLLIQDGIRDIVPIGSRGIRAEAHQLADQVRTRFIPESNTSLDLDKSAGPSTCAIFTCDPDLVLQNLILTGQSNLPLTRVGTLAPLETVCPQPLGNKNDPTP